VPSNNSSRGDCTRISQGGGISTEALSSKAVFRGVSQAVWHSWSVRIKRIISDAGAFIDD